MRISASLEKSCSCRWKSFNAPFLRIGCAQWAFEQGLPRKSLRHFFAQDLLQFLKEGDAAERLYACDTLLSWRGCGLGRFQDKIFEALREVVLIVFIHDIPWETRGKALQAMLLFLPKDAAQRYPNLWHDLRSYRLYVSDWAPQTMLLDLDILISTLAPLQNPRQLCWSHTRFRRIRAGASQCEGASEQPTPLLRPACF